MDATISIDRQDLQRLEEVISRNRQSFYEVARALAEIRDRELYKTRKKGEYQTFAAYCRDVWDISRARAYQQIAAAQVQENLSTIVDKIIPESQARPLTKLSPGQQLQVWQKAVETAPEGKMTAAHLSKIIRSVSGEPSRKKQKPEPELAAPETAASIAKLSITHLERIADDDPFIENAFSAIEDWIEQRRENIKSQRILVLASTNCTFLESDGQTIGISN